MMTLQAAIGPADHIRGDVEAPVTLVEYGDYECPACGRAYPEVERARRHLGANLRFVFRHFPLTSIHPLAEPAAEAAEFAGAQGRFWEMHDGIYQNQSMLSMPTLLVLAAELELSETELRAALQNHSYQAKLRADILGGTRSGVRGTPTFFINGVRHDASYDFATLVAAIEQFLPANSRPMPAAARS
jgi:protein-disulfide isomerase